MSTSRTAAIPAEPALQDQVWGSRYSLNSNDVPTMARADAKLQDLLKELTCEIPPDDAAQPCKPRNFQHPPSGNEDAAWGECSRVIESHDDDLCKTFREQIDTLMVFAGLFSAIVGGFSVEAYQWLSVSPMNANYEVLAHAVLLLSQNTTGLPIPAPLKSSQTLTGAVAARINIYFFLSLTLSLTSALIGILCKQWVRQFSHQPRTTGPELVGVRQMKYEGLEAWGVGKIISFLPLLLQLALGLFLLGILELLWNLHRAVAIVVTVSASLTMVFYLATTLAPAFQYVLLFKFPTPYRLLGAAMPQCPYKSPQSLLVLRMMTALFAIRVPSNADDEESLLQSRADSHPFDSWVLFDGRYDTLCNQSLPKTTPKSHWRGLSWLLETTSHQGLRDHVWHCLWANALRHSCEGQTSGTQLHSSPGPWHVLKTDPRTEYIANTFPEPQPTAATPSLQLRYSPFTSQSWWAATIMYSVQTSFTETTRLEIYIRGLSTWSTIDPLTAYHVLDIVLPDAALKGLKLKGLPGSLVRCAMTFYNRNRATCVLGMGHFLRKVAACLSVDSSKSADAHFACLSILYLRWLREWGYRNHVAVAANNATMAELIVRRVKRRAKRLPHGRRDLHSLAHIEEFAELLLLMTLPYWDSMFQGPLSQIDWDRFHPTFTTKTLRENEALFRDLVAIAIPDAWRTAPPVLVPRTISAPMTRKELEYLFLIRRTLSPVGVSPRNNETGAGTSQSPGPVQGAIVQQQLDPHVSAPDDVLPASLMQDSMPEVEHGSLSRGERAPNELGTEGRTGEPRYPMESSSHARVALAGHALVAPETVPRAVPSTGSGPEAIRTFSADSASRAADPRQPVARPPRPNWLILSQSIPSLLSLQSGDVRSESPDSRRAGSGGSTASAETSPPMLIGLRRHGARMAAALRRDTGDGASQAAFDVA